MSSFVALLKKLFRRIGNKLPTAVKRMLVLASITSLLSVDDKGTFIRDLNAFIIKAKEDDALRFARGVARWVWGEEILSTDPAHLEPADIVKQLPEVFQYANDDVMRDEIQAVIQFSRDYPKP